MKKSLASLLLVFIFVLTNFVIFKTNVFAVNIDDPSVLIKQEGSDWCTYASATNMIRRRALLDGNSNWSSYTDSSLRDASRASGGGMSNSFKYAGYSVISENWKNKSTEQKKSSLISLLSSHPEGIVIYTFDGTYTHAILACNYTNGTFYVADPAKKMPSGIIKLTQAQFNGSSQDERIGWIKKIWYINGGSGNNSYTPKPTSTPTPTPSSPASISLSKSSINLDLSSKTSDTVNISLSGTLPSKYKLDFDCSSSVNISWGGWTNNDKSNSITVTAKENTQNGSTATIYLRDADGKTYATKTFTIYVTKPQPKLTISSTSVKIDHVNQPTETVKVSVTGMYGKYSVDVTNGIGVTATWGKWENNSIDLTLTANWRLGNGDETLTLILYDENKKEIDQQKLHISTKTKKYNVIYDANGGYDAPSNGIKYHNDEYLIPYLRPERDGYAFMGWATSKNATTDEYNVGDHYTQNKDITLYAVWDKDSENQKCGDNAFWELEDGVLTISGFGKIYDYENIWNIPWFDMQSDIKKIVIEEGITYIGNNAFCWHDAYYKNAINLEEIYIPSTVEGLGNCTFAYVSGVDTVYYNAKNCAFQGDSLSYAYNYFPRGKKLVIGKDVKTIEANVFYRGQFDEIVAPEDWDPSSVNIEGNEILEGVLQKLIIEGKETKKEIVLLSDETIYLDYKNGVDGQFLFTVTGMENEDYSVNFHCVENSNNSIDWWFGDQWTESYNGEPCTYRQINIYANDRPILNNKATICLEDKNGNCINEKTVYIYDVSQEKFFDRDKNHISVYVNGEKLYFDVFPMLINDRTLVPLRAIFEALGATVLWDEETQTVTSIREENTISLQIGSNRLYKNGQAITIDVPAQVINDRTLVPVRAISESMDCTVGWYEEEQVVEIFN